jgi:hypothetical protein
VPVAVVRYEDLHRGDPSVLLPALRLCGRATGAGELAGALHRCRFTELARAERERGSTERAAVTQGFLRAGRNGDGRRVLSPAQIDRLVRDHAAVMRRFGYPEARLSTA